MVLGIKKNDAARYTLFLNLLYSSIGNEDFHSGEKRGDKKCLIVNFPV